MIKYVIVDDHIRGERWYLAQSYGNATIDDPDGVFWAAWKWFMECSLKGGYTLFNTREEAQKFIKDFFCDITYAKVIEIVWRCDQ